MVENNRTFPQFRNLPPEIRDRIWYYCLPRRVVPVAGPLFPDHGPHARERDPLALYKTAALPSISSVCRESRNVVFRFGSMEATVTERLSSPTWVQRTLDVILYRLPPLQRELNGGPDTIEIGHFLSNIRGRNDRPAICLLAEHFVRGQNRGHSGVKQWGPWESGLEDDDVVGEPRNREVLSHLLQGVEHDRKMDVDVVMKFLPLPTTPDLSLASGLFGLAGDEHSQLVDCDDLMTLAKFRALHDENVMHWPFSRQDKLFRTRYETVLSLHFQNAVKKWLDNALELLLVIKWRHARRCDPANIMFEESKSIIVRPPETFDTGFTDETAFTDGTTFTDSGHRSYVLNEEHPWVIEERRKLPKLRPKIWLMFWKRKR